MKFDINNIHTTELGEKRIRKNLRLSEKTNKINETIPFNIQEYDKKIIQTIPYYEEFYKQISDVTETYFDHKLKWLDIGCGTGKTVQSAVKKSKIEKIVFCDSSEKMINIVKERFSLMNAEFYIQDIRNMEFHETFDVITAIQVNHYLNLEERKTVIKKCYDFLKCNGMFITFENFAPFTEKGKNLYLDRWKKYQKTKGKTDNECNEHIDRYGKNYFPITISEHINVMKECGFDTVEVLWVSGMQVGLIGIRSFP